MNDSQPPCSSNCQGGIPRLTFYQAFIFSIPIVFALVLLLLFYKLYMRRRNAWRESRMEGQYQAPRLPSAPSQHGLKKEFRDRLPTIIFNESLSGEDTQCSVCLAEYQINEDLHRLPICGHAFHLECIDHWLTNNTTCPLCRTSLLQATKVVPLDLAAHGNPPLENVRAQQTSATLPTPTQQ